MNSTFEALRAEFQNAELNNTKFEKGNQAAGTRLRRNAQNIKNLCSALRKEVIEAKNAKV